MNVAFRYGSGFAGNEYYMIVDGESVPVSFLSTEDEAKKEAKRILIEEFKHEINIEDIHFEWDGTM